MVDNVGSSKNIFSKLDWMFATILMQLILMPIAPKCVKLNRRFQIPVWVVLLLVVEIILHIRLVFVPIVRIRRIKYLHNPNLK